jgi:preprotein translocase subunit Sec63
MGREFAYDESGATSYYFFLSVLVLYVVPASVGRFVALVSRSKGKTYEAQRERETETETETERDREREREREREMGRVCCGFAEPRAHPL